MRVAVHRVSEDSSEMVEVAVWIGKFPIVSEIRCTLL